MWGNIAYVLAAAGYLTLDCTGAHSNASLTALALLYTASALLYWVSWKGSWPHPVASAIAGEYLNIAASFGFFCTALTYSYETGTPKTDPVYGGVTIAETFLAIAFVVDALLYAWAWHVAVMPVRGRRGWTVSKGGERRPGHAGSDRFVFLHDPRQSHIPYPVQIVDVTIWSHLFNVLPSVLATIVALVGVFARWSVRVHFSDDPSDTSVSVLRRAGQVRLHRCLDSMY